MVESNSKHRSVCGISVHFLMDSFVLSNDHPTAQERISMLLSILRRSLMLFLWGVPVPSFGSWSRSHPVSETVDGRNPRERFWSLHFVRAQVGHRGELGPVPWTGSGLQICCVETRVQWLADVMLSQFCTWDCTLRAQEEQNKPEPKRMNTVNPNRSWPSRKLKGILDQHDIPVHFKPLYMLDFPVGSSWALFCLVRIWRGLMLVSKLAGLFPILS